MHAHLADAHYLTEPGRGENALHFTKPRTKVEEKTQAIDVITLLSFSLTIDWEGKYSFNELQRIKCQFNQLTHQK